MFFVFSDNGASTTIGLKIIFSDLPYDSGQAHQWVTDFENKVRQVC